MATMSSNNMSRIGPTAHYTAQVWYRHGLSHAALSTRTGRLLHGILRPVNRAYERLGHRTLDTMLLVRHQGIDRLLERAVDSGAVGQVIELAAGLSPRGMRFARRYRDKGLVYVESDLPAMAAHKRRLLDDAGLRGPGHHVVALDALATGGPESLAAVAAAHLDPARGTAIITEGLLAYLDHDALAGLWQRIAACLAGFPRGTYLSDLNLRDDAHSAIVLETVHVLVYLLTREQVTLHFDHPDAAAAALRQAGFGAVTIHEPAALGVALDGSDTGRPPVVRLIEASAGAPGSAR